MAVNKKHEFDEMENWMAQVAKSMAHPARIAILKVLMKRGDCYCGDIVDELPLAQATVSQHLKELKNSGLIKGEIEGPKTCYCIDSDACDKVNRFFGQFFYDLKKCC